MKVIIVGLSGVGKTTLETILIKEEGYIPFTIYTNSEGHGDQPSHYVKSDINDMVEDEYLIHYKRDDGLFYAIKIPELRDDINRVMTSIDMTLSLYDMLNTHEWMIDYRYIHLVLPEGTTIGDRVKDREMSTIEKKKRSTPNPMTRRQLYLLGQVPEIVNCDINTLKKKVLEEIYTSK